MPIDWFTVGAQLLNFLILVGLLKRFLYHPILGAIDDREQRISDELKEAEARRDEAEKERARFEEERRELEERRDDLLAKARDEADAERRKLVDKARADADAIRAKRNEALEAEHEKLKGEIARRMRDEVFFITRKTLEDLAGTSLEQRVCEVFAERLHKLGDDAKAKLMDGGGRVLVRSAFDLPERQQGMVRQALNETFSKSVDVGFETSSKLVSGIELVANGQKLGWNIKDYLASMEDAVDGVLKTDSTPGEEKR